MNVCTLWWRKNIVTNFFFQSFAILNFHQANIKINLYKFYTQNKVVQYPKNINSRNILLFIDINDYKIFIKIYYKVQIYYKNHSNDYQTW